MAKKKFKVEAKCVTYSYVVVEADSIDEANDLVHQQMNKGELDGGDFITTDEGYFEVVDSLTREAKEGE